MSPSALIAPVVRAAKRNFSEVHYNREAQISQQEALRRGWSLDHFRKLSDKLDGLAGFPPEFLPVLLFDLRFCGLLGEIYYENIRRRMEGLMGAFREAGELLGSIDRDGDGWIDRNDAMRAGLSKNHFEELDRDRDGRIDYLEEFIPRVVNRLFADRLIREEEYAKILSGLIRTRRWRRSG